MSNPAIHSPALRHAFESAARSFDVQRGAQPAGTQGAARQIVSPQPAAASVEQAIASAAQQTGVDFDFLVAQAQVESAMNPEARARTSSATGLYQFIDSTWLQTMARHGDRFGLGNVAAQIAVSPGGSAHVPDPGAREAILALRNDPQIAALMAAGLAEDNRAHLAPILGREPDHGELYLAHFLGAGGAGRFLSAMADDPNQSAASLFQRPAAANRPVFYEGDGSPRSLAGVMNHLSAKLERARDLAPGAMAQGYAAAPLSPPEYLIADEAVFGPLNPPTLTGRNRPTITGAPTLSLAPAASRGSMSEMLRSTFGEGGASAPATREQVARAYDRMKALGF